MPRKPADPDLIMVTMRLRQSDIAKAKAIAKAEGTVYQRWLRNRISDAAHTPGDGVKVYKLMGVGTSAVVLAHTAAEASAVAASYAKGLEDERASPIATIWSARATPVEMPAVTGVVSWIEMGVGGALPPRPAPQATPAKRSRRRKPHALRRR